MCCLPELIKDAEDPNSKHDFGHNILPNLLGRYKVNAFNFVDENKQNALYWRDVGTLEAYYEANMDVATVSPVFNLYDKSWPMRTRPYQYPPAKFVFGEPGRTGMAINSIISSGCIVSGSVIRSSVLSHDVRVNSYSGCGLERGVFACEYWAALPDPARDYRSRRAYSGWSGDWVRPERG